MSELHDLELENRPPGPETPRGATPGGPRPSRGGGNRLGWIVILVLALAVLALGVWYVFFRPPAEPVLPPPEPAARTAPEEAAPPPTEPEEEPIELPPLNASDALVREMVEELSSHPRLASWLATDELIRKFVATVDNIAEGTSPRPHLQTAAPSAPFPAIRENDEVVLDPEGYRRYDSVVAAFSGLDPAKTVELYHRLKPLIEEAYRQLGYPDTDFDDTLERAIVALLEVPVVEGEVPLVAKVKSYEYADPRLEGLTDAQKHLLRTGPDNVRRVQAELRALARELGIPRDELPERRVLHARGAVSP
jgi:hypothetical protein